MIENMKSERELALYMASVFDQIDRHNDSINSIKKVILLDPKLNEDERILFSHVYKNALHPLRNSLQRLELFLETEHSSQIKYFKKYKSQIFNELEVICKEFIGYVDNYILPVTNDSKAILFYEKTKGDFYRYITEYMPKDERTENVCKAKQCYEKAVDLANKECIGAETIYQGLFLNYCIFLYDFLDQKKLAIEIAEQTIDAVMKGFEKLYEENDCIFIEGTLGITILKDNLAVWKNEMKENE